MHNPPKGRSGKRITLTQINDNQFLIEGQSEKTRIVGETEYSISFVDFDNGPLLHIGKDFLGMGTTKYIEIIDSENPNHIIIKVTIE